MPLRQSRPVQKVRISAPFSTWMVTLIDGYSARAYFADRFRRREMGLGEAVDIVRV